MNEANDDSGIKGELIVMESLKLPEVFTEKGVSVLLKQVKKQVVSIVPDLSTDKGRKAIASLAYKISQTKKPLEEAGKGMVSEQKAAIKIVDSSRIQLLAGLDAIRDEVRAPLTAWEAEEAKRVEELERKEVERLDYLDNIIAWINQLAYQNDFKSIEQLEMDLKTANEISIDESFMESQSRAEVAKGNVITTIQQTLTMKVQIEKDRVELEVQQKAQAKQQEEIKKQQDAMAEQQRIMNEKQAEMDRKEQARLDDIQAEADQKAELERQEKFNAEAKIQAEKEAAEKVEADKLFQKKLDDDAAEAAALKAEQAPDKEKLTVEFFEFRGLQQDYSFTLKTKKAEKVWVEFHDKFEIILRDFEKGINSL